MYFISCSNIFLSIILLQEKALSNVEKYNDGFRLKQCNIIKIITQLHHIKIGKHECDIKYAVYQSIAFSMCSSYAALFSSNETHINLFWSKTIIMSLCVPWYLFTKFSFVIISLFLLILITIVSISSSYRLIEELNWLLFLQIIICCCCVPLGKPSPM